MSAVSFKSVNVGDNEVQITKKIPDLDRVYYIPYGLSILLVGNIDSLFGLASLNPKEPSYYYNSYYDHSPSLVGRREIEIEEMRPIDKEEPRIFIIEMSSGYSYTLSLYPDTNKIFSEQIKKDGKLVLYRDKVDSIPIIGPEWKGDNNIFSSGIFPFNDFHEKLLFGLSPDLIKLHEDIKNLSIIDQANDFIEAPVFKKDDLGLVNKVVTYLFNDTVAKVHSNGSYETLNGMLMPYNLGGGGYKRILHFLDNWIRLVVNDCGTLIVRHWDCGLHPLLSRALMGVVFKKIKTKGTLFLEHYEYDESI